jgi:MFS family permease
VNPIVDDKAARIDTDQTHQENHFHGRYGTIAALLGYAVLQYITWEKQTGDVVAFLASVLTYFLLIYLYYGIARLAYQRSPYPLWGGAAAAIVLSYLLIGLSDIWGILTGWGMLLFAGVLTGRLSAGGHYQGRVYVIGAVTVAGFFALQSYPLWTEFLKSAPQLSEGFLKETERFLSASGYSPEAILESLDKSKKLFDAMIRLFPAFTLLAALLQYSVGYLAFNSWASRKGWPPLRMRSFIYWKMPFGMTPLLIVLLLMRFWGGESSRLIADNVLVILAVYYCVAGLALMEYYLRKLSLSLLMRVVFYILLFVTQLIGFLVAALLGFIDSFADWRKIQRQEVT